VSGNTIAYSYDGFDRLSRITHPPANPNPALFEEFGYDAAGNRTLHRTRAGQDIVMAYDALNRIHPANAAGVERRRWAGDHRF
jgi:YD repeat-containing protein